MILTEQRQSLPDDDGSSFPADQTTISALYLKKPLDKHGNDIRLLKVRPETWHEPIVCDFQVCKLDGDSRPSYAALSYVWGTEAPIK
jgi:hypothetical protein